MKMTSMKRNIVYTFLASLLIVFAGCDDSFLDAELLTEKTDDNFYSNKEDAFLALVGCYDGLQQIWAGGISFPVASDVFSDNNFGGTGATDGFGYQMLDEFDKDRAPSDLNVFEANWTAYYATIFKANKLIQSIEQINWEGDDALRNQYESEARFIRAFCYFDLVRMFGHIPLTEVPTRENLPQADPADVYSLIATDLQFGAENMSNEPYSEAWAASNDGRVTKWAAESLLARVFLYYTGYYGEGNLPTQEGQITEAQALEYLEDVINNSGHDLVENYASLWPAASVENYAGEGNVESIFSIKYTYTSDYNGNTDGNHWMVMYGIRQTNSYPYGTGWGGATVNPDLWDLYGENDTRRVASITSIDDEEIDMDITNQREYTGYYAKKYSPMSTEAGQSVAESLGAVNFQIGQFQDFVSIRFADVLLMAAELGSSNAQQYFDRVRGRAYGENYNSLALTPEILQRERRLEFAFEGIRYWDLLRQGMSVAAAAINESGVEVLNAGEPETKTITFDPATRGLQQIPYNQINLSNGVLEQNTGW